MNPIPKEQLLAAYQRAPQEVRDAFNGEVTAEIIMDMKTKYRLHVDVAGNLGNEVGYMLLGLRSPAEFFGNLMLSGTDEQTSRAIMEEVSQRIFIPLKRQMTAQTSASTPVESYIVAQEAQSPQTKTPVMPVPTIEYTPPVSQTLPGSPVAAPMPTTRNPEMKDVSIDQGAETSHIPQEPLSKTTRTSASITQPSAGQNNPPIPIKKDYAADPYRESV